MFSLFSDWFYALSKWKDLKIRNANSERFNLPSQQPTVVNASRPVMIFREPKFWYLFEGDSIDRHMYEFEYFLRIHLKQIDNSHIVLHRNRLLCGLFRN